MISIYATLNNTFLMSHVALQVLNRIVSKMYLGRDLIHQ